MAKANVKANDLDKLTDLNEIGKQLERLPDDQRKMIAFAIAALSMLPQSQKKTG